MKYMKIPMERVGVLIGPKGSIKKEIENKTKVSIDIDSKTGEITIDDHDTKDPINVIKAENLIKAIGRGFSPERSWGLLSDDSDFFVFDLYEYASKKETHVKRLKSRVIGREGKTKRLLESLTDSRISVYGHTVAVISDVARMNVLKKAIDMLLTGSKHATVYRFVELQMKELKRMEKMDF